ncbi:MAG: 30S ribosomal protein S9 [Gemmatimonadota bacterium]
MADQTIAQAVGRRKAAVARVWLRPGSGEWEINGRSLDEFFPQHRHREAVSRPFAVTETEGRYAVHIRVRGGGLSGQAGAIQLAIARAILAEDEDRRAALRARGLLTRDARVVERKKPGRPKARKRFQFSKR